VRHGRFVTAAHADPAAAVIDAAGGLVLPGLVEAHLHLDKALLDLPGSGLADAIRLTAEHKRTVAAEDIARRARTVIEREVLAGTTLIRAHTDVDPIIGLRGLEVMLELRREFAPLVDIQVVAFPQEGVVRLPGTLELLRAALDAGADVLGGCVYSEDDVADSRRQVDLLLELAGEQGVPLDLHADLADDGTDPRYLLADYVADRVLATGFSHPVALGHVTSWAGIPPVERDRIVDAVRAAEISVVVLPATDMHFGGRADTHAVRRGIAPVARLWEAGIRVACASNNVRNAFTPYGNADPLETALFLAQTAHVTDPAGWARVLDAVTTTAAEVTGAAGYGTDPGCRADAVVLDVGDEAEALLGRPARRRVLKGGRVVAESERRSRLLIPGADEKERDA